MRKLYFALTILIAVSSSLLNAQPTGWSWSSLLAGTKTDAVTSLAADDSGYVFVAGHFYGLSMTIGTFTLTGTSSTSYDAFIAKFDKNGTAVWAKAITSTGNVLLHALDASPGGEVVVGGKFSTGTNFGGVNLVNSGGDDCFIAKYSKNGNLVWVKQYNAGSGNIEVKSIAVSDSGNIYACGDFYGGTAQLGSFPLTNAGTNTSEIFILKLDSTSTLKWARSVAGNGHDYASAIALYDTNEDVYVTGNFESPVITTGTAGVDTLHNVAGKDFFLTKLTTMGVHSWSLGAGDSLNDLCNGLAVDASGNAFITGSYLSTSITLDTTVTLTNAGIENIFVAKFDPAGQILWGKTAGNTQRDAAYGIAVDLTGNAYMTGKFDVGISFGTITLVNSSPGTAELFLTKIDPSGNYLWAISAEGTIDDFGYEVCVDTSGAITVAGDFDSPALNFGSGILLNKGFNDGFIARVDMLTGKLENLVSNQAIVYPNPATAFLNIEHDLKASSHGLIIKIFNVNGQLVKSMNQNSSSIIHISLSDLKTGIYSYHLTNGIDTRSGKFAVSGVSIK